MFDHDFFQTLLDRAAPPHTLRGGIYRFTPDQSYSRGNFELLREKHHVLQFDSRNGTQDRYNTLLKRTGWPPDFFNGKLVLECGCGAGPDTEILLKLGAKVVAVDLAGGEIAARNIGENPNVQFVQASIMNLPFRTQAFDIVFCHRVLQHTPDPAKTLRHILSFAKPDGAVFVHSYARSLFQTLRWKYALRPLTTRMQPDKLYGLIEKAAPYAYRFTCLTGRTKAGRAFNHILVPFLNYRYAPKFAALSDDAVMEYGIHDTFDALSPPYDRPLSAGHMRTIARERLTAPFEIVEQRDITLLRTTL